MLVAARRHVGALLLSVGLAAGLTVGVAAGGAAPVHADATTAARLAATRAIGAGHGEDAAAIIATSGLADRPQLLGRIIYEAGVIAVRADLGDEFSQAVATAFFEGGVTFANAQRAFVNGSLLVVTGAPRDPYLLAELGPGGVAVLRTELAYFGWSLPSLAFL